MEISKDLADRVVRLVHSVDYRPSKPKQIATSLKLDAEEYRELRRVIKWLVHEGQLAYGPKHLIISPSLASGNPNVIRGTFRRAAGGFGFVRPVTGGTESEVPEDIFVPPGMTLGALEGDMVQVELRRSSRRGDGIEGAVEQIVERGRRQFTGTFHGEADAAFVYLDGFPYDAPVSVGDVRGLPLQTDDKVVVEMVDFPNEQGVGGEAVILEVLGSSKNPAIDTLAVMRQYHLPETFADDVIAEARQRADAFDDDSIPTDRRDLTDLLTLTIDPHDARDFDDAISLKRENGRWILWVHIADVSHFIEAGGKLDTEAQQRATSVYLPGRVVPMIPEIISNHLASLQPERIRLTKTVEMEMLDDGTVTSTEVYNAVIRSDLRLTYGHVDRFLADPGWGREKWGEPLSELLTRMHSLAMSMRQRRIEGGSLTLDMPEIELDLDKAGKVKGASLVVNTESHQVIEEFMLAANQAVATWLDDQELHFLHRIHPPPDRRKLQQLSKFVRDLGIDVDRVESRFEIQRVLDSVVGTPLENAVNFAVLKAMNKAVYGPHREGHYALDMQHYCHFTSPIRRYPDLTVHRLIQKLIDGKPTPDEPFPLLVRLGHHCSDQERNADQAERELVLLKLLHHLKKHLGETMEAVVSRVFPDGLYARCIKLPVDGFVPITSLPKDQYRFERRGQMIVGFKELNRFRLGDQVTIRIAKVDIRGRQLTVEIVANRSVRAELGNAAGQAKSKSKSKGKGKAKSKSKKSKRGGRGSKTTKGKRR